jgi:diamine N-acetyltransferase
MVDERFQGRGIGAEAVALVIAHVCAKGLYSSLEVSYMPGEGCPEPFYRKLGFEPTGRVDEGEIVLRLPLSSGTATRQTPK